MAFQSEFRRQPSAQHTYDGPDKIAKDPLPGDRYIRLLKLFPAVKEDNERIEIELENHSLDLTLPSYTALTYTWRSEAAEHLVNEGVGVIFSNGRAYGITENLRQALGHLRSSTEVRYLWIDQLCIRQTDEIEKSQQIPLMKAIYQSAREGVTAWLGSDEKGLREVIQYISHVAGERLWDDEKYDLSPLIDFSDPKNLSDATTAMIRLLSRPWFSRIWVVQEAAVQKTSLTLRTGEFCFSFEHLIAAVEDINRRMIAERPSLLSSNGRQGDERNTYFLFLRACPAIDSIGAAGRKTLQELVQTFCCWDATNSRDKLYALMGLASDTASYPAPNYSRPTEEVYQDFARVWLTTGLPNVLSALTFAASSGQEPHLPSWATSWKAFGSRNPISPLRNNYKFQAGGVVDVDAAYSFDGHCLSLNGVTVDKVHKVSSPLDRKLVRSVQWLKEAREIMLLCREKKAQQNSQTLADLAKLIKRVSDVVVPYEDTERQQAPQETKEQAKLLEEASRLLSSQQQRAAEQYLSEADDLAKLFVLDGQSSLYQLVGQEEQWFDTIAKEDLPELGRPWNDSLFSYSSHTSNVYKGPVTKYPLLGVNPHAMRFENPSAWPNLSNSHGETENVDPGTGDTSEKGAADVAFDAYKDAFWAINVDQRIFLTENGRIGIASGRVSVGDHVTVLQGGRMPFITKAHAELPGCRIASEAYVRGIMHGECVEGVTEWGKIVIV